MGKFNFAEFGLDLEERVLKECACLIDYSKFLYSDGRGEEAKIIMDIVESLHNGVTIFNKKIEKALCERNTDNNNNNNNNND